MVQTPCRSRYNNCTSLSIPQDSMWPLKRKMVLLSQVRVEQGMQGTPVTCEVREAEAHGGKAVQAQ